jgi:glycosyltransferase involved in cell wall biosynthesis
LTPIAIPVRKNPGDLVRAFQRAFPAGNEAVRLLIRLNNADTDLGRAVAAQLQKLAMGDARIRLLLAPMSYPEVISLYASADVFVSLHRGEGLGLGLMEAMALGKPVIATGWSGNMSFMNQSNSCLVRYRLTEVSGHWDFFKPAFIGTEARWAVPVLEDAVSWMRALHADKALCNRIGTNARVHALAYQVRAFEASWIGELAAMYCVQALLPRAVRKYSNTGRQ